MTTVSMSQAADSLEAAMTLLPTRVYTPARHSVKALRILAMGPTADVPMEMRQELAQTLRSAMPTVSKSLADSLKQAADLLSPLS